MALNFDTIRFPAALISFILISLLAMGVYRRRGTKENHGLLVSAVFIIFILSILPSIKIPYIRDEIDIMHSAASLLNSKEVLPWLLAPHNEHIIFFLKIFYLLFYKIFWLNPEPFHILIIVAYAAVLFFIYQLLFALTKSRFSAFIGLSLLAITNMCDMAIFFSADSHIIFCTLFFLMMFYAQCRYESDSKRFWRFIAFLCPLVASLTFALGLTSILFAFLFERLCLPKKSRDGKTGLLTFIALGWLLSLPFYLFHFNQIIHAAHYRDVGVKSILEIMDISGGILYLLQYLLKYYTVNFLANRYFSVSLFLLIILLSIIYRKDIAWKMIIFFFLLGATHNGIIYTFRIAWVSSNPDFLIAPRYSVIMAVVFSICYALIVDGVRKRLTQGEKNKYDLPLYFLCFLLISTAGDIRYEEAQRYGEMTKPTQRLYVEFRDSFVNYFKISQAKKLTVKNARISEIISSKGGFSLRVSRYPRPIQFYAELTLPNSIKEKIIWSEKTDKPFLDYLRSHRYESFIGVLE